MKLLQDYFKLQKELHEYFGYVEDWVVIPMDDETNFYWELFDAEINYAESINDLMDKESGEYYSGSIYTQRFLLKYVYRGEDYTMISVDTQCDGNKFLMIFDNKKEIKSLNRGE